MEGKRELQEAHLAGQKAWDAEKKSMVALHKEEIEEWKTKLDKQKETSTKEQDELRSNHAAIKKELEETIVTLTQKSKAQDDLYEKLQDMATLTSRLYDDETKERTRVEGEKNAAEQEKTNTILERDRLKQLVTKLEAEVADSRRNALLQEKKAYDGHEIALEELRLKAEQALEEAQSTIRRLRSQAGSGEGAGAISHTCPYCEENGRLVADARKSIALLRKEIADLKAEIARLRRQQKSNGPADTNDAGAKAQMKIMEKKLEQQRREIGKLKATTGGRASRSEGKDSSSAGPQMLVSEGMAKSVTEKRVRDMRRNPRLAGSVKEQEPVAEQRSLLGGILGF